MILGNADLTGTLERQVKALCNTEDEFMHQDEVFSLDYRCVSGDVSLPENAFRTQDFLPHGKFSLLDNVLTQLVSWVHYPKQKERFLYKAHIFDHF